MTEGKEVYVMRMELAKEAASPDMALPIFPGLLRNYIQRSVGPSGIL
jgi:hypothetical protein